MTVIPIPATFSAPKAFNSGKNADNNHQTDLQERIKNANKTYFMIQTFLTNNIYNKLQVIIKNTTIYKTLTHASESWILTERDRKQMNIFERKVHRRILGLVYEYEKENRRILTNKEMSNKEMYAVAKIPTITETIRLYRLR
jgi:hypothetical protein